MLRIVPMSALIGLSLHLSASAQTVEELGGRRHVDVTAEFAKSTCHFDGRAYTTGGLVRFGDAIFSCVRDHSDELRNDPPNAWWPLNIKPSGCTYDGGFFSEGAKMVINNSNTLITCFKGEWQ